MLQTIFGQYLSIPDNARTQIAAWAVEKGLLKKDV
jgi:hypothetical protein